MVEDYELQELYRLLADVLDGYNRTHDAQVQFLDFYASDADGRPYDGSVVVCVYDQSIIDFHYRDLRDDDFDWFTAEDWAVVDRSREVERILSERRKMAQRYHREGRDLSTLWFVRCMDDAPPDSHRPGADGRRCRHGGSR